MSTGSVPFSGNKYSSRLQGVSTPVFSGKPLTRRHPLVSILIPAFNAEKWIGQAVQSAVCQSWPDKEVIVVDDGSRDETLSVTRAFESRHCKVLSQESRGASAARNHAFSHAQGDFIQWLDADDLLAPDKIEHQFRRVESVSDDRALFSSPFWQFYNHPRRARQINHALCQDLPPLEFMLIKFRDNVWMNPSVWLLSRRIAEAAGPWDESLSLDDDGDYFCRAVLASDRVLFVPQAKSYKRIGVPGSLSGSSSPRAWHSQFSSLRASIFRVLAVEDSERVRKACLTLLQRWFIHFYPDEKDLMEKMNELAHFLGGSLSPPRLRWKYSMIQKIFGWDMAIKAQRLLPCAKTRLVNRIDKMLYPFSS